MAPVRVTIQPAVLAWAVSRTGLSQSALLKQFPKIQEWEAGEERPTLKQAKGLVRLPLFSGHPISTDLVSVGEDVHCEFVKEEVHPGVPAGGRQTGH